MEAVKKCSVVLLVIILTNGKTVLHASPVGDSLVNADLNGKELIKMGNVLNKTLLTLIGETFVKMEQNIDKRLSNERQILGTELCKLKTCTEWTEWSQRSARVIRTFGANTRTRTCGGSSSICPSKAAETVQTDSKVCQGTCKYTSTKNRFCIKLNNTTQTSWKTAQEDCHQDGGHLINIDSELKAADVEEILEKLSFSSDIWIDGTRTLPNGEWKHEYGSKDTTFSKWRSGEPGSSDNCKAYSKASGQRWWYGRPCTSTYYYLCELF